MEMVRIDAPASLTMPIGEAMFTQRATRRLDPSRPISDEQIKTVLDAASKAPNGGNAQPARFLVIRDRKKIEEFGALYFEAWWAKRFDAYGWTSKADIPEGSVYRFPALLADEMVNAPVVVLAFSEKTQVAEASTFPGVQNLLLAARALGIGSVLTTLHAKVMGRVNAMFGIPDDMVFHCCIPLGYPRGNFGPTSRLPTSETTYWDKWGSPPPWK
ncbi:MAG: nitroreductase family protein [Gammaproteobacteria bacterium]|nr:nitroreductase family protein [Gammaproteobacteria bacterium]